MPANTDTETVSYSSDSPINSRDEDRFDRAPFATRIAETIAARKDTSSLIVAIYGAWGDGKTSVLNMIQEGLRAHPNVVIGWFNPWFFNNEVDLIRSFFAILAAAVGKSPETNLQKIGDKLRRYGHLLSLPSIPFGIDVGQGLANAGEALSAVELEELRDQVEEILKNSGRRVVIFIDDIDRLDRAEIQALFKLVRLSAGFSCTTYVLAFDDAIVASSLGERYGRGNVEAGRVFLDKIVQVPLRLPPAEETALRRVALEGVDEALRLSGIAITEREAQEFMQGLAFGLQTRMTTPRQARLYGNALQFALPILKGEVRLVDQLLIEGVRLFYPELYAFIRDNSSIVLQRDGSAFDREDEVERIRDRFHAALSDLTPNERQRVITYVVERLFPNLQFVFSNTHFGSDWDEIWTREKRICSEQYFRRYFTYGIPHGDIGDEEVGQFVDSLGRFHDEEVDALLAEIKDRNAFEKFIMKLREREDQIPPEKARLLATSLARNGDLLPREQNMLHPDWTFRQSAILISHLTQSITADEKERSHIACQIVSIAQPLPFAVQCFVWMRPGKSGEERVLTENYVSTVGTTLANRVKEEAKNGPLYVTFGRDTPRLLYLWKEYGDPDEVEAHITISLEEKQDNVDLLLASFVGLSWGMETGLSDISDLDRDAYDTIVRYINPKTVAARLKDKYGDELNEPRYYQDHDVPVPQRLAHQFMCIHQQVSTTANQAPK